MENQRGITIHFTDGTTMKLEFPPQDENSDAAITKLKDVLKDRQLLFEVDGAVFLLPFENIKYIQVYPVPADRIPPNAIRGASLST